LLAVREKKRRRGMDVKPNEGEGGKGIVLNIIKMSFYVHITGGASERNKNSRAMAKTKQKARNT
jgi:hypothetical protein